MSEHGAPSGPESPARAGVRLLALCALLVVCVARWNSLLINEPALGRMVAWALLCAVVATVLVLAAGRVDVRLRIAATAVAAAGLLGGALLVAGVPLWMLDPWDWDALAAGLREGISALPGVTVPYRGSEEWVRITIACGGALLAAIVALSAGWPRSRGRAGARGWTLLALGVLFAVPAIQRSGAHPWLAGALFAIPLCLFVLAERLPVRLAAPAAGLVLGTVLVAMALSPAVDRDDPLIDVQEIASALEPEKPDRFDWTHNYGPLDWPRDGRELLRVRADRPGYWKAEDLELFDGVRWRLQDGANPVTPVAGGAAEHPRWRREVRVTVKGMQTRQFIAPGETLAISRSPRRPMNTRAGGFTVALDQDPLSSGDAYLAESYVPRPTVAELRVATAQGPGSVGDDLSILASPDGSAGRVLLSFPPFGSGQPPIAAGPGVGPADGLAVLERSGYGDVYRLAQELAAGASSPYDFVRRVERHLTSEPFVYEEDVPQHRLPLVSFLLQDHAGYCQHYSGAMALLLRMGGVPARVSSGFTPGQHDTKRGEYIVRDLDAHSWVEVWFDDIGWVTFDPTPSDAPARSQDSNAGLQDQGLVPSGPQPSGAIGADVGPGTSDPTFTATEGGSSSGTALAIIGAALALAAAGSGAVLVRRRRAIRAAGAASDVAELERALRRSGRPVAPGTTLLALERRFAHSAGLRDYVRTLAARRYGSADAAPSGAQRRALRRSLASGSGLPGRLRALWALPPRGLH